MFMGKTVFVWGSNKKKKTLNITCRFKETWKQYNNFKLFQSEAHHGDEAPDETKVCEMVGVDGRGRVDLQTVVVFAGVFEETVHRVEHLVGQQKEPLPAERKETQRYAAEELRRLLQPSEAERWTQGSGRVSKKCYLCHSCLQCFNSSAFGVV